MARSNVIDNATCVAKDMGSEYMDVINNLGKVRRVLARAFHHVHAKVAVTVNERFDIMMSISTC